MFFFFFNDTATTEIYTYLHTLSLHDALPIWSRRWSHGWRKYKLHDNPTSWPSKRHNLGFDKWKKSGGFGFLLGFWPVRSEHNSARTGGRSEEHTSELQSLMRISYAVFCLKKKNYNKHITHMILHLRKY